MVSTSSSDRRLLRSLEARISRRRVVQGVLGVPIVGSALLAAPRRGLAQDDTVRIGSKDFAEQFILAEIYGALLDNAGISVDLGNINLGGTGIAHEALINGEIDMYPEYPGTAFETILGLSLADAKAAVAGGGATPVADGTAAAATPAAGGTLDQYIFDAVSQAYLEQFNVVLLDQSAFNDTQALAVTREFSEENGITTISQLAAVAGEYTIVGPSDFETRADGLVGLQEVYDAGFADVETLGVQPGLRYQALEDGDAEIVLAFSTEGQIPAMDLVVLQDDLGLWPPYHCAPFVRKETLDTYPQIAEILNPIAPLLTDEVMADLNGKVDLDGEEPADVATAWLEEQGLLTAE
jgi:osmoprotectant transport system substrate-binding protein